MNQNLAYTLISIVIVTLGTWGLIKVFQDFNKFKEETTKYNSTITKEAK